MGTIFRRILLQDNSYPSVEMKNYLTIVALEDGLTAKLSVNACQYCIDCDGNWRDLPANTTTQEINQGQTLSFKGELNATSSSVGIGTFTISKNCNLAGNCMSLLFGDDAANNTSITFAAFSYLFKNCKTIVQVSESFLPATTLANYCYRAMFSGCTNLIIAPKLPATTLAIYCYSQMFSNCSVLTTAPELPATTLVNSCYYNMFNYCRKLNYIKAMFTTTPTTTYTNGWVAAVSQSGTFVKNKNATWDVTGTMGIPSGWTVITE